MQNHNLLKKQIFSWSDHIPCLLSLSTKLHMRTHPHCIALRKNTAISPDFLVWKFCGKAQFPHSFGRFALNYEETVPFRKISTPENQVKLWYFSQRVSVAFHTTYPQWRFWSILPSFFLIHPLLNFKPLCRQQKVYFFSKPTEATEALLKFKNNLAINVRYKK